MPNDTKTLDRLLMWLGVYVAVLFALAWMAGKIAEAIPVVTNLVSGFAGAAFAIMRFEKHGPGDGPQGPSGNG